MKAISPRQLDCLRVIDEHMRECGYAPTVRDLRLLLDVSSTNSVSDHLKALRRKGFLEPACNIARGIAITAAGYAELGTQVERVELALMAALGLKLATQAERQRLRAAALEVLSIMGAK